MVDAWVCGGCCIRKHWEEESGKKGDRFDLEAAVGARGSDHDMLLKRAENLYESLFSNEKGVRVCMACCVGVCHLLRLCAG